ncbi:MAG TPA: hypothetical protein VLI93_07265 [Acetobacteraceae bacterium]|nr:hypothetical protein [Acetobacteraceae bacterium]
MTRNVLSDYLDEIARIRGTRAGTGEISYYGALARALNTVGESLKPRVFCVPNLRNRGAGFPDMGLFITARGRAPEDWPEDHPPDRGVVEVDDIPAELSVKIRSEQVRRYLARYGLVLVTNYRDFVLLGRDGAAARKCANALALGARMPRRSLHWRAARAVRRALLPAFPSFLSVSCCIRRRSPGPRMWRFSSPLTHATRWHV